MTLNLYLGLPSTAVEDQGAISQQTQARLIAQVKSLFCYSMLIERMTCSLHKGFCRRLLSSSLAKGVSV